MSAIRCQCKDPLRRTAGGRHDGLGFRSTPTGPENLSNKEEALLLYMLRCGGQS